MKQVSGQDLRGVWVPDPEAPEDGGSARLVYERREEPVEARLMVRPQFVGDLMKNVAKFQKIAARHGQQVEARLIGEVEVPHPFRPKRKQVRQEWAVIIPPMVGVKGRIVGHFEKSEDGKSQYVHVFSEDERAACEALLPRAGQCDHCAKNRARVKSFVVEFEGRHLLVGKNCLIDYMGIDPGWALAAAEWFEESRRSESEGGWGGGGHYRDLMPLVEAAFLVARKHGGYPSGDDRYWFRNHVSIMCYGARNEHDSEVKAQYKGFDPGPLDLEALADYVEGAQGDFGANLRIAFEQDMIHVKRSALVIAGVAMWVGRSIKRKDDEKKAEKLGPPKAFAEKPGSRIDFEAEVIRAIPRAGQFGVMLIIALRCADGRQAVNFHSGEFHPEAGKRYKVRASIKKHQPGFRNIGEESVLSRAVYQEIEA